MLAHGTAQQFLNFRLEDKSALLGEGNDRNIELGEMGQQEVVQERSLDGFM